MSTLALIIALTLIFIA